MKNYVFHNDFLIFNDLEMQMFNQLIHWFKVFELNHIQFHYSNNLY